MTRPVSGTPPQAPATSVDREAGKGAGLARVTVNGSAPQLTKAAASFGSEGNSAFESAVGKVPWAGLGLGVVASGVALNHFNQADAEGKTAALATTGSTVAQGGKIAATALGAAEADAPAALVNLGKVGKVGTPLLTAVAQGATAVDELRQGKVYNGVTSGAVAVGAALLVVPGAQPVGLALIACGVAAKVGKWAAKHLPNVAHAVAGFLKKLF